MYSNNSKLWRSQRSDLSFWLSIALWARTTTRRTGVALKLPLSLAPFWPPRQALVGPIALAGGGLLLGQWLVNDLLHVPGGGLGLLAVITHGGRVVLTTGFFTRFDWLWPTALAAS